MRINYKASANIFLGYLIASIIACALGWYHAAALILLLNVVKSIQALLPTRGVKYDSKEYDTLEMVRARQRV